MPFQLEAAVQYIRFEYPVELGAQFKAVRRLDVNARELRNGDMDPKCLLRYISLQYDSGVGEQGFTRRNKG